MKQKDLVKMLVKAGFRLDRHGGNHDIYVRGTEQEAVPRHKEIKESTARAIIKKHRLR